MLVSIYLTKLTDMVMHMVKDERCSVHMENSKENFDKNHIHMGKPLGLVM